MTYMRKYGKIYTEKLGTMNIVHIFDPRDIAAMFRNEGKHPSRGTIANLELTYLRRNNLLVGFAFIDGPEWTRQRGVIQRLMMHPLAAARFLPMQVPVAQDFVTYIRGKRNAEGIVPDLYSDLFKFTMEAIGVVCFNERLGALTETGDPTRDAGELSSAIQETFFCFRNCMFNFPWYKYFRTPMYRRFEKAANKMRL
ncbi:hypothetical protein NP493_256g00022 [Ridgeia piscesae]|uniref:Cytochrome P450 n=1 Tax=Ridgeia piscesae TaxID=27915 RepID=A0AAD9NYD1_RIDPI|nr:hypothetical protein NP493_256g00022 [Ridgeia piscesae]